MIYLDYNATTPVHFDVLAAMQDCFETQFGNPSSFYRIGREAKQKLHEARVKIASAIGADPLEIYFTSGGTESDNLALRGMAKALQGRGRHLITTAVEHHAVLNTCRDLEKEGFAVTYLPVDSNGRVDPETLAGEITSETILISVMYANNETGVIQPLADIGRIARERDIAFHTDAVQAAGKIPIDVSAIRADLLSVTGHKLYGPKGAGALYVRKGIAPRAILTGGRHEQDLRAGTENVPGIVGLGEAFARFAANPGPEAQRLGQLRDRLEEGLTQNIPNVCINGCRAPRISNTANVVFPSVDGESILLHLDLKGIYASSGSACATGSPEPSHVLKAMGLAPRAAQGSIRFSLGNATTAEEIDQTIETVAETVDRLRRISSI